MPETVHDVKISRIRKYGCARVENMPPEEFGVSRRQRTVMLRDCDYCYHEVRRSEAELIADGYDKEQVKALPDYAGDGTTRRSPATRWTTIPCRGQGDAERANRQIRVTEHYVMMDYEGDGKPRRYRVTTGGSRLGDPEAQGQAGDRAGHGALCRHDAVHQCRTGFSARRLPTSSWTSRGSRRRCSGQCSTMFISPTTSAWRWPRTGRQRTRSTTCLANSVGGIIRTRRIGSVAPVPNQPIGTFVFPMMEYMDTLREWRTGVTRQGQGLDPNALQNIGERAVLDAQKCRPRQN